MFKISSQYLAVVLKASMMSDYLSTSGRRQSKTLSTIDERGQKSIETVFLISILSPVVIGALRVKIYTSEKYWVDLYTPYLSLLTHLCLMELPTLFSLTNPFRI